MQRRLGGGEVRRRWLRATDQLPCRTTIANHKFRTQVDGQFDYPSHSSIVDIHLQQKPRTRMPRIDRNTLLTLSKSPQLITEWLGNWQFDRFITLTFNDAGDGKASSAPHLATQMRRHLRDWDARMNRILIGKDWLKRQDNRMFHFFTPEKIVTNPHWHGLVSFFGADATESARQGNLFDEAAEMVWKNLVPAGTVDVKVMDSQDEYISYVAKSVCSEVNYDHFIVQDEFLTR